MRTPQPVLSGETKKKSFSLGGLLLCSAGPSESTVASSLTVSCDPVTSPRRQTSLERDGCNHGNPSSCHESIKMIRGGSEQHKGRPDDFDPPGKKTSACCPPKADSCMNSTTKECVCVCVYLLNISFRSRAKNACSPRFKNRWRPTFGFSFLSYFLGLLPPLLWYHFSCLDSREIWPRALPFHVSGGWWVMFAVCALPL